MMAATLDAQLQHPHHLLPPPQPFNRVTTCERHPEQQVTGFCASCLRERLAGLDTANRRLNTSSSASGASAALKSLFFRPTSHHQIHGNANAASLSKSSFLPELRRCKSFSSGGRGPPSASAMEPQRKSCDVRVRNTLWSLFHLDDGGPAGDGVDPSNLFPPPIFSAAVNAGGGEIETEPRSRRFDPGVGAPVFESRAEEEEEDEEDQEKEKERYGKVEVEATAATEELDESGDEEIKAAHPVLRNDAKQEEMGGDEELPTMKDHIDLSTQSKKPSPKDFKEIAGSFWLAASVFSKKLQKWRRKQKLKKHAAAAGGASGGKVSAASIHTEKRTSRSRRFFRDTQSELAEDAFGRRSCDTDPRFSLDAGRISFDDPRFSWDEPRASWDGYLTGSRSVFPRLPPMLSVLEDAPVAAPSVQRLDGQIPVEEDSTIPGGSDQTRDYYLDSSQRRRRSLDRSSSVRRCSFEADELAKPKGSPTAMAAEYLHLVNKLERDCRDSNSNSLRDDLSESFDSAYREPIKGGGNTKKSRRWSKAWSLWGLIHRRSRSRAVGPNVVERSFSETWPELQRGGHNGKVLRCNSSVSSRHSLNGSIGNAAGLGSTRRNGLEINGYGKKRAGEFVLERNRSARFSPSHVDNGMLRFYLTPMRSSRRSNGGSSGKGRHMMNSHAFTRSMLQLY